MTFEDYQKQSNRLSAHSVIVTPNDCHTFFGGPVYFGNVKHKTIGVYLKVFNYTYIADEQGNMWTIDDHGNPKSRSVFRYKLGGD